MRAGVIDYDLGNLPSVTKALERIGVEPRLVDGPDGLTSALDAVVLPGVGHFGAGMRNLRRRRLDTALRQWAEDGKPLLGICVGLQLFMESSDEDPGETGLGILRGTCRRVRGPKVPHMGWNTLEVSNGSKVLEGIGPQDRAYFVHSYYVDPPAEMVTATTTHNETFASVVEQGRVVGVQFHPEKSAGVGRRILQSFFSRP